MSKVAERIANSLTDEYWYDSTRETFVEAAEKLLNRGWSEEETEEFLASLFDAVSNEYGD